MLVLSLDWNALEPPNPTPSPSTLCLSLPPLDGTKGLLRKPNTQLSYPTNLPPKCRKLPLRSAISRPSALLSSPSYGLPGTTLRGRLPCLRTVRRRTPLTCSDYRRPLLILPRHRSLCRTRVRYIRRPKKRNVKHVSRWLAIVTTCLSELLNSLASLPSSCLPFSNSKAKQMARVT